VYADELEQQGMLDRANVVRAVRRLRTLDGAEALAAARELLDRAEGMPRSWLLELSTGTNIAGQPWGALDGRDQFAMIFETDGKLRFREGLDDTFVVGPGWWMQVGEAVAFSIEKHDEPGVDYSRYEGLVRGEFAWGPGNALEITWRWELEPISRIEDEAVTARQRETDDRSLLRERRWPSDTPELDPQRTEVVALVDELAAIDRDDDTRHALATRILDRAAGLPRPWLRRLPTRELEIERWRRFSIIDHAKNVHLIECLRSGELVALDGRRGHWMQIGAAIHFTIGDDRYEGSAIGTSIAGVDWNAAIMRDVDWELPSNREIAVAPKTPNPGISRVRWV
jgi:hypothetical protein